jgi:hypothetical protein
MEEFNSRSRTFNIEEDHEFAKTLFRKSPTQIAMVTRLFLLLSL